MKPFRWVMMAVVLCWAAGAAVAEEPPDARLQEAQTVFDAASALWDTRQYADAIAKGEQALALREAVLGGAHPDVATCLDWLGRHRRLQGAVVQAEPLLLRALAIRESALGKDHPEVAQTLNTLAQLYGDQALYSRAEPLFLRALAIREAALGQDSLSVAELLNTLAYFYSAQRAFDRAEPLFLRALAIREAVLGKDHLEVAQTLCGLGALYELQGRTGRAKPILVRALAIREAALGPDDADLATSVEQLANFYQVQGLYAQSEPLLARAVAIREAALSKNPPDAASSLWHLANLYLRVWSDARAEPLLLRAVALREEMLGQSHPLVADLVGWLGLFYVAHGVHDRAEPLLERAVAIREAALGRNHPLVADVLLDLGELYVAQGLYARAEPVFQRAWALREAAFGKDSRFVATPLLALGSLYMIQGLYARAEPLLQRGLAIEEAVFGKSHFYVAKTLCRLGNFYLAQGLYARAEPLLRRALDILEAAGGRNHVAVATPLSILADLYAARGLYRQARPLYERARSLVSATLGENHPSLAETLNRLGGVHLALGDRAKALPLLTRAFELSERRLRQEALGFSEVRLASFLQLLRTDEERLYALLRAHPDDAGVRRLALGAALLLKGRSVEESADISRTIYAGLGAQDRDTFERLRRLHTQLAQMSFQGPGPLPRAVFQRQLDELAEQGAVLEADLAKRSAPLRTLTALPSLSQIVDRVAAALPEDAALVEFLTYRDRPLLPKPGTQNSGQLRYLALVLFPDGTLRFRDLGRAERMDSVVLRLRDALAIRDADFQVHAQALYALAFKPLLPLLGTTRHLLLAPDGQLALVPFAALHDGQQFLVDTFDFTYLPSGKSLLSRSQESAPADSVVVLADPDFNAPLAVRPVSPRENGSALTVRSPPGERFFSGLRADLSQRDWAPTPLPGTRQEAEAIQRMLPQAQLFLGSEATKDRLLQLPAPGILHLATHGFFLEDAPVRPASRGVVAFGSLSESALAPNPPDPLLRSGLVLAGTSAPAASGSSSVPPSAKGTLVTALELAGLNLWGTQLVVLSACDTGRGDIKLGQGVYGLRRAFLVAGAETVVLSLWKVNDETTHMLMEAYYRHLLAGQGRAAALREAMLELRQAQAHPHYWAPFLAMGRETPLRSFTSPEEASPRIHPWRLPAHRVDVDRALPSSLGEELQPELLER